MSTYPLAANQQSQQPETRQSFYPTRLRSESLHHCPARGLDPSPESRSRRLKSFHLAQVAILDGAVSGYCSSGWDRCEMETHGDSDERCNHHPRNYPALMTPSLSRRCIKPRDLGRLNWPPLHRARLAPNACRENQAVWRMRLRQIVKPKFRKGLPV